MSRDAAAFQAYAVGDVCAAVLSRYAHWQVLRLATFPSSGALPTNIVSENELADANAVKFAKLLAGLNAGQLEIAHRMNDEGGSLVLGIVRAGSIPHSLALWPIVPVIVVGAVLYGAWVLADAWLSMRTLEAQSDSLRAKTQAAVSDAVARAGAQSPQAAAMLADALERANNAASGVQPGLLDKLAGAVADVGTGIRDSSGLLLLLGAAWLWSRRGAA
jgi:hypothetical protein